MFDVGFLVRCAGIDIRALCVIHRYLNVVYANYLLISVMCYSCVRTASIASGVGLFFADISAELYTIYHASEKLCSIETRVHLESMRSKLVMVPSVVMFSPSRP